MCLAMLALKGHQGQAAEDTSHHPSGPCKLFYKKKVTPMGFSACSRGARGLSCPSTALPSSPSRQTPRSPASTSPRAGSPRPAQVRPVGEPGETSTTAAPGSHLVQESLAELLHGSLELVSLGLPLLIVPDIFGRGALPCGGPGVVVHVVIPASRIHTLLPPGNTRGRCHCLSSDSSAGPAGRCLQLPCGNPMLMLV